MYQPPSRLVVVDTRCDPLDRVGWSVMVESA
jgi:hypothetical protein